MSSLDVEKLLLPISEESPCGEDLEYDPAVMDIEKELEGKSEQQMGDSVIEAEEPDWKKVFNESVDLLDRTHDFRVLIYILRAGLKTQGFSVLSDCFSILSGWVESQWEHVYPQLDPDDDNDPTERVNVIMALCDFDVMLNPLVLLPVVESNALGKFNLKNIREANEGGDDPNLATIEGAFTDSDLEQLEERSQQVNTSIEMLEKIENDVTQYVGVSEAPNLEELVKILKEILGVLSEYVVKKGGSPIAGDFLSEDETGTGGDDITGKQKGVGTINSSQDVIKALEMINEYYMKNEPSSPVPMLLERAKGLVNMDFMSIIKNIASEGEPQINILRGPVEDENDEY